MIAQQSREIADFQILDPLAERYEDPDDLRDRVAFALQSFPELEDTTVILGRDDPGRDRNGGALSWTDVILLPPDERLSNVTLYHELAHVAIRHQYEEGKDVPRTSEKYCGILGVARTPPTRMDEDRVPYIGPCEVVTGLAPKICQAALHYREEHRNYAQRCMEWLAGDDGWQRWTGGDRDAHE